MSFIYQVDLEQLPTLPCSMAYLSKNGRLARMVRQARYLGARAGAGDLDAAELGRACLDVGAAGFEAGLRSTEIRQAFEAGLRDAADAATDVQIAAPGARERCTLAQLLAFPGLSLSEEETRDLRALDVGGTYSVRGFGEAWTVTRLR